MFKGRHFDRSVILLCVRWYLAYNLSLRNLEEMMAERGISVDHATVHRWVVRYSPALLERFNRRKRAVAGKWHVDDISRSVGIGGISTALPIALATPLSSG
jgi:transposase-like protein